MERQTQAPTGARQLLLRAVARGWDLAQQVGKYFLLLVDVHIPLISLHCLSAVGLDPRPSLPNVFDLSELPQVPHEFWKIHLTGRVVNQPR